MKAASYAQMLALAVLTLAATVNAADAPPGGPPNGGHGGPREACKGDVQGFCADVKPGGGRIVECLKAHNAQLSAGCKDAMTKMAMHHHHPDGPPPQGGPGGPGEPPPAGNPPPPPPED